MVHFNKNFGCICNILMHIIIIIIIIINMLQIQQFGLYL